MIFFFISFAFAKTWLSTIDITPPPIKEDKKEYKFSEQKKAYYYRSAPPSYLLFSLYGMPLNDNSTVSGAMDLNHIDRNLLKNAKYQKDSSPILYGANAASGVMEVSLFEQKSSFTYMQSHLGKYHLNANFLSKSLSFGSSYSANEHFRSSIGEEKDPYKRISFWGAHEFDSGKNKITPFFIYLDSKFDLDAGGYLDDPNYFGTSKVQVAGVQVKNKLSPILNYKGLIGTVRYDRKVENQKDLINNQYFKGNYLSENVVIRNDVEYFFSLENYLNFGLSYEAQITNLETYLEEDKAKKEKIKREIYSLYALINYSRFSLGSRVDISTKNTKNFYIKYNKGPFTFSHSYNEKLPSSYQLYSSEYGNKLLNNEKSFMTELIYFRENHKISFFNEYFKEMTIFKSRYENGGQLNTFGFEYTYSKKFKNIKLNSSLKYLFKNIPMRPRLNAQFDLSYKFFKLTYNYHSKKNQYDPKSYKIVKTKAVGLWGLNIKKTVEDYDFELSLNNLLNTSYNEVLGYTSPGRELQFELTKYF